MKKKNYILTTILSLFMFVLLLTPVLAQGTQKDYFYRFNLLLVETSTDSSTSTKIDEYMTFSDGDFSYQTRGQLDTNGTSRLYRFLNGQTVSKNTTIFGLNTIELKWYFFLRGERGTFTLDPSKDEYLGNRRYSHVIGSYGGTEWRIIYRISEVPVIDYDAL